MNKTKQFGPLIDDYAFALMTHQGEDLPTMPSPEDQARFTGLSQWDTMRQAVNFLKCVELGYLAVTNRSMESARILDFGCGWGRMLRLLPVFTDQIYGCDPLQAALDLCKRHGVPGDLRLSDYIPTSLPFPDESMDLIFAYSVFTHTSMSATISSLNAIRKVIAPGGILAITIRPREYWLLPQHQLDDESLNLILASHDSHGFSFRQNKNRPELLHFGKTSITLDWIKATFPNWKIARCDCSLKDQYQHLIFLSPA